MTTPAYFYFVPGKHPDENSHLFYLSLHFWLLFPGHNAIMIVAESLCVALWLAILLSFAIIATVGYILHSLFTFKQPLSFAGFGRYTISMLLNIPLAFVSTGFGITGWNFR